MKEKILRFVLAFSPFIPGLHQFINKDFPKGLSLSIGFISGMALMSWGSGYFGLLGFVIMMISLVINMFDIIDAVFKPITESLNHIAESLDRIAISLEQTVIMLKAIESNVISLGPLVREKRLLLPKPKDIKLLPVPPKRILLPASPAETREVIYLPAASVV